MKDFCNMVNTQFETKVNTIRSDNASEFTYGPMKQFYAKKCLLNQTSWMDIKHQNGSVER